MQPIPNQWIQSMSANSAPYPVFTAGQQAVYDHLSNIYSINPNTKQTVPIRDAYSTFLWADLNNLANTLAGLTPTAGDGFTEDDFSTVQTMLAIGLFSELSCAMDVAGFFVTLDANFYNGLFALEGITADEVMTGVGLADASSDAKVGLMIANIVVGVATSVLNLIPGVGGFIAGLVQTTVQAVEAGITWSSAQPPAARLVAINNYFAELGQNIQTLSANLGDIQDQVCGDWGMMQWVARQTGSGGQLNLTGDVVAQITSAANQGFFVTSLQTLLPVNYALYYCYASDTIGSSDVEYAYWADLQDGKVTVSTQSSSKLKFGSNTPLWNNPSVTMPNMGYDYPYTLWWIAEQGNAKNFLDNANFFALLNGNVDVFSGQNGWAIPPAGYNYANIVVFRVANDTPLDLKLINVSALPGPIQWPGTTVPAYTTVPFVMAFDTGSNCFGKVALEGELQSDTSQPGFVNCGFVMSMPHAIVEGQPVTLSISNWNTTDFVITGSTVAGSFSGDSGGGAVMVISPLSV